jgi:hypothetical protein
VAGVVAKFQPPPEAVRCRCVLGGWGGTERERRQCRAAAGGRLRW